MSAEAASTVTPSATVEPAAPVAAGLAPKNTHRLNRILRKPKASLPPRPWHVIDTGAPRLAGVPPSVLNKLLASLTEEDQQRAAAGQEPLTVTQEALIRRAARFGLQISASNPSSAPAAPVLSYVVDEETLRRREARFSQAAAAPPPQ
ncbi:hypothetical protein NESM_000664900 [Novymonas esmeraldas]|uniref:Uncharacterized protein n=1 Tax=Novymonas esmeraldas TaxID=1808958 RepID=A0AAW0EVU4_9TRYP